MISYNTSIVREGLVLHLDAANKKSYPGSGTTWFDLSGKNNSSSLINSVDFSTDNNGYMNFDGVNDYVEIINDSNFRFTNTQEFSISAWVNCNNSSNSAVIFAYALTSGRGYYFTLDLGFLRNNSYLFDYWDGSRFRGIHGVEGSIPMNSWVFLTATSSTNSVDNMEVYLNDNLTSHTNRGTGTPNTINYDSLALQIGARQSGNFFEGSISQVSVYNRALSASEVKQNFEALRGRYGI